ncbi:T9SS type A sorting domain-containing protein [bacterium]|nr:T9SS type A sorting domain-containing protein [bacterium]
MKALFAVLIICGSALAQEARFFEIPVEGNVTSAIATGDGNNIVHVFYNTNDGVYHVGFDIEQGTIVFPPQAFQLGNPYPRSVQDAEMLENGQWITVVTGYGSQPVNPYLHRAWVVRGLGGQQYQEELIYEEVEDRNEFVSWGPLTGVRIAADPTSGYVVVGVKTGHMGPELAADLYIYPLPPFDYWQSDQTMFVSAQMFHPDTLQLFTVGNLFGTGYDEVDLRCLSACEPTPIFWESYASIPLITRGRQTLAFSDNRLLRLNSDGSMDSLGTTQHTPESWERGCDMHPDFGFAFLTSDGLALQLVRVDTLGNSPASFGIVGWNTMPNSATVNFASNGDLLVAYGLSDSLLGLAVVPWDAPLSASDRIDPLPMSFSLSSFPNPFNSSVKLEYEIAKAGEIELAVFNTLGQKVETLFAGNRLAGKHSLTWSPNTSSGVYFVKLASGKLQESRKILYLR